MKKRVLVIPILIFLTIATPLIISAQNYKLNISTSKEIYSAGENLNFKVVLLDETNNPINTPLDIITENAERSTSIQKTINPNEFTTLDLGENASFGYWSISANYKGTQTTTLFIIEAQELAKFSLMNNTLIVTNIGNTKYTRTIQIIIGNTIGAKTPRLDIGESATYNLVAPEGNYNIKVSDGKTTFTKSSVKLTGKTVGVLDEAITKRAGITGGSLTDKKYEGIINSPKQSELVCIFIFIVFVTMILVIIKRKSIR